MAVLDPEELSSHYHVAHRDLLDNIIVPFLGAGVSVCNRQPREAKWQHGMAFLPTGGELSAHLASRFGYTGDPTDLARVAEYVSLMSGPASLYQELKHVFDPVYPLNDVHRFMAEIPSLTMRKTGKRQCPLIVTTNYDDLLERALDEVGEKYHLVTYIADGEHRGKFRHTNDGHSHIVEAPNQYYDVAPGDRTVVLKIHGGFPRTHQLTDDPGLRPPAELPAYVITEDHYIDYLTRTELSNLVPVRLVQHLSMCRFLFIGYGLRDWNLRVILHRISSANALSYTSWAIQKGPSALDRKFWSRRNIDILETDIEEYLAGLRAYIEAFPDVATLPGHVAEPHAE
jgi:SIR2-like domain